MFHQQRWKNIGVKCYTILLSIAWPSTCGNGYHEIHPGIHHDKLGLMTYDRRAFRRERQTGLQLDLHVRASIFSLCGAPWSSLSQTNHMHDTYPLEPWPRQCGPGISN